MGATPFIWVDGLSEPELHLRHLRRQELQGGSVLIERVITLDAGKEISIPDVSSTTGLAWCSCPARPSTRSRLLTRDGDMFRVYLRFFMKKVITVVVNSGHDAYFTRDGRDRARSRSYSTRIAEVEAPDTPEEREKPVG
jgi:hypothetical protein